MMLPMRLLVLAIWCALLIDAVWAGWSIPDKAEFLRGVPAWFSAFACTLPVIFFPVVSMFGRRSPFHDPVMSRWVDARWGTWTFDELLTRLAPMRMLAAGGSVATVVGAVRVASLVGRPEAWIGVAFYGSCATGCGLALVVLRRRNPAGA